MRVATGFRSFALAAVVLAGGCDDESDPEGEAGGAAWWNQPPPFVVASTLPSDGSSAVDLCVPIRVTFSRDADGTTVSGTTFTVTAGGPVAGNVVYTPATRTATFTPTGPLLAASTLHTVTLTSGILSASGEPLAPRTITFTTSAPFGRILSNPAPGASGIPINTSVSITFNKPVNTATLTANDFAYDGTPFASHTYDVPSRTLTLTPGGNLPASTTVDIALIGFVQSGDGCFETLSGPNVNFSFDTSNVGDTTPPAFAGASSATAPNAVTVVVSWSPATDNVTPQASIVYRLYKGPFFGLYFTTAPGATSFTDTNQTPSTSYSYIVRARDGVGNEDTNSVIRSVTTPARRSWATVYSATIVGYGCTGCHGASGGLNLGPDKNAAHANMVGVTGFCGLRVSAGNSSASSLFRKVERTQTCGSPMPPSTVMLAADVDAIRDWIDEGAPNN